MQLLQRIPVFGFWALLIYMPFHIFLAQSVSLATGGLEVWKIGKDAVLALLVLFSVCLVFWQGKATKVFRSLVILSVGYGLLHALLWALNPEIYVESALLGTLYNIRLPAFLLLGMAAYLLRPSKFAFSFVFKIVLSVSTIVAFLGVVQYFLPSNILTHVGYGVERGVLPAFFIDDHPDLPRVMSTLREPNALGAYLVLPIAALTALLTRVRNINLRFVFAGSLALHMLALFFTHSRSAWLAAATVIGLVLWWQHQDWLARSARRFWPVLLVLVLLTGIAIVQFRETAFFQGYIVHTTELATGEHSSTELHYILARDGAESVANNPAGYGPGTAGLASIQSEQAVLTENYYIQLAYEVGVAGLLVFLVINLFVYRLLWKRRDMFGLVIIASFWGYVLTNMLLHSWANEAVAAQWWLLAGVAIADSQSVQGRGQKSPKSVSDTSKL